MELMLQEEFGFGLGGFVELGWDGQKRLRESLDFGYEVEILVA